MAKTATHIYNTTQINNNMYNKSNYAIIRSFKAFLRISNASFKNLVVLYSKDFYLEATILLNLFNVGQDWWPKYL